MKKKSILIGGIVVAVLVVIGLIIAFGNKKVDGTIKNVISIKKMFNTVYKGVDLPAVET